MTDTIEQKALALVNEVRAERRDPPMVGLSRDCFASQEALCRAIEQHEAFRQEVSDAVQEAVDRKVSFLKLRRFIIAKPVDPLVEVLNDMKDGRAGPTTESYAACIRAAMKARGYEWRKIEGEG